VRNIEVVEESKTEIFPEPHAVQYGALWAQEENWQITKEITAICHQWPGGM
jgi:hypothetical protein